VIFQAHKFLPLRRPIVVWQIVSHKFLRPLVPFAMIGALLANIGALLFPAGEGNWSWLRLASPYNVLVFTLQCIFYGMALLGNRVETGGLIGKLLYIPTFLVNSNYAALLGLYQYWTNKQAHIWERVERSDFT
jgi:hypothetical protein